jgi:hypothetical protein
LRVAELEGEIAGLAPRNDQFRAEGGDLPQANRQLPARVGS